MQTTAPSPPARTWPPRNARRAWLIAAAGFWLGAPAVAADCSAAATAFGALACEDADLGRFNTAIALALTRLSAEESPPAFATIRSGAAQWRAFVARSCGADGPLPDDQGDRNAILQCLTDAYRGGADLFGPPEAHRAGPLALEPRMRFRGRFAPDTEESDVYPVLSGGPQAAAFNAYVEHALALAAWRMDDKTLFRYGPEEVGDLKLHAHRLYAVRRFDSRIIALLVSTSDYVGGHDEERGRLALNWDLKTGRPVTPAEVFRAGAPWRAFAAAWCRKALRVQTEADGIEADFGGYLDAEAADGRNWLWRDGKATVLLDVTFTGGSAAAPYEVDIPYKALAGFITPDAPLH